MMYNQQPGIGPSSMSSAQTPPGGKKPTQKRKSNQQISNPTPAGQPTKLFMSNGMPQNNMPSNMNGMMSNQQHYQVIKWLVKTF